ncbi:hypothetical protein NA57DRAFT_54648 [Rhizodiscina lignyota]|uniref:Fe2OG dioxygenase domain-containing protein n=1 Tax=Rhizodiscina lignyota TaxID=1504668 RepID=A0A9P4MCE4_9PEZI|nr:hypothetical protein NA57DRAFT_54648 [Rhizodiscina lignyota]
MASDVSGVQAAEEPPLLSIPDASLFDADAHLAYTPPATIHSLADLGLPLSPLSPIGSTDPFPLLTQEAVEAHRREIFSKDVIDNCLYVTRKGSCTVRGMAPRYAPFINAFWKSKEVLEIVSRLAGVELVPVLDHEICHTNVQLGPEGVEGVKRTPIVPPVSTPEAIKEMDEWNERQKVESPAEADNPNKVVVPWHRDSHPFVCVVMLSDTRHMTGGETELMRGDGTTVKVRSPQYGGAVVLQGRHVSHLAHPAKNMPERITVVTAFRPKDPRLFDDSSHMNVRKQSRLPELFYQWTQYRLKLLTLPGRRSEERSRIERSP